MAERTLFTSPALFIFAHHDDEFFIAATMRRLAAAGGKPGAVWLTRGGLGGSRREEESRRAMALLGLDPANLRFFRLPDCGSLEHVEAIVGRLRAIFLQARPATVCVPAFEGGHPDHDVAQLAAAVALAETGQPATLLEFPLYHRHQNRFLKAGEFLPGPPESLYAPLGLRDRLLKKRLTMLYQSQWPVLLPLLALKGGPMLLHPRGEPYRLVPAGRDYTQPPHEGRLAYEFYTRVRFSRFRGVAERISRRQGLL